MVSKYEWLKPRVKKLVEIAKPHKSICPDVFYDTGAWSIIKLLALLRFVNIYTKIIKAPRQARFFRNMYYIDLLAGNGLCRIGSRGDVVAGSALIACTECYHSFDKHFLVEKDLKHAEALEARIGTVTPNFKVFNCDCNNCIEEIMEEIGERDHYLAFVDCEGLDVSWATMLFLFAKKGDVLFNFQTQNISRLPTKVKNQSVGWKALTKRLNWFFGDDRWKDCQEPDDFLKAYISKIQQETTRNLVLPLPVKGRRGYRYDIILATRITSGGSPWIKPMEELQNMMGGYRPKLVEKTLDILMKRQLSLNNDFA
ncbi:three-Cys-motif partner protein TcmP [Candidatus Bathyarchaeota archaeon]|nr:three-Cys-motif partner protein TcmP [Candidatus Bathyarchaeota archaeon]